MKNLGCYNTDAVLWENFFRDRPSARLTFTNGAVISEEMDVMAVFPDNEAACRTVEGARVAARKARPA